MPNETITLTTEEKAELDLVAAARGVSAAALLTAQAQEQIPLRASEIYKRWFIGLSNAAQKAIYDANQ